MRRDVYDCLNQVMYEELRFEHVTFAYDDGKPIIKELNLTIQPGGEACDCPHVSGTL